MRLRNAPSTNPSIKLNNGNVEVVALELDTGATGVLGLRDHSLNIDVNGNVGIGTNAPGSNYWSSGGILHIKAVFPALVLESNSGLTINLNNCMFLVSFRLFFCCKYMRKKIRP